MNRRIAYLSVIFILTLALAGTVNAGTRWTGTVDSDFYNLSNWTGASPASTSPYIGGYAGGGDPNYHPIVSGTDRVAYTIYIGGDWGDGKLTIAAGADILLTPGRDMAVATASSP